MGEGSRIITICGPHGHPVAVHVASASHWEPHVLPATLDARFLPRLPVVPGRRRGYDSDGLDDAVRQRDDRRERSGSREDAG
jgi:hypothetical protein